MKVRETDLPGVLIVEPDVFGDPRGRFLENWHGERYQAHGLPDSFAQANTSYSTRGVLRGLHYQWPQPQGKLVWVGAGRVLDVAVDIRPDSPHFRRWTAVELDAERHHQLWIPEGFAHGFQVLSEAAAFCYLCTRPYRRELDMAIAFDDPDIGVDWPLEPAGVSDRDAAAPRLRDLPREHLPRSR